jgi:hypothetical protein
VCVFFIFFLNTYCLFLRLSDAYVIFLRFLFVELATLWCVCVCVCVVFLACASISLTRCYCSSLHKTLESVSVIFSFLEVTSELNFNFFILQQRNISQQFYINKVIQVPPLPLSVWSLWK